jgi:hypothetical protein
MSPPPTGCYQQRRGFMDSPCRVPTPRRMCYSWEYRLTMFMPLVSTGPGNWWLVHTLRRRLAGSIASHQRFRVVPDRSLPGAAFNAHVPPGTRAAKAVGARPGCTSVRTPPRGSPTAGHRGRRTSTRRAGPAGGPDGSG